MDELERELQRVNAICQQKVDKMLKVHSLQEAGRESSLPKAKKGKKIDISALGYTMRNPQLGRLQGPLPQQRHPQRQVAAHPATPAPRKATQPRFDPPPRGPQCPQRPRRTRLVQGQLNHRRRLTQRGSLYRRGRRRYLAQRENGHV